MKTTFKTQANANKLYIMFADLKEYSANKDSLELILKMENALYTIGNELFPENEHCFKVLGDGMLATDKNPVILAEKALKVVEKIRHTFENDGDFQKKPQIRIALHLAVEPVSERYLQYEIGEQTLTIFKDIAGKDVINTARIEPVVKPNYVFCSQPFAQELTMLASMGFNPNIETESLGTHKLGKEHDNFEIELFSVFLKTQKPNTEELKQHINAKLEKREETYKDVSPLTGGYINYGTQVMGDMVSNVGTFIKGENVSIEQIGNNTTTNHQNAEKIYNIDKIDKADFN